MSLAPAARTASSWHPAALAAVAAGGGAGSVLRWALAEVVPDGAGLPWTTFATNVVGSCALALLLTAGAVDRRPTLAAFLGPGLLGGFTTLSAYADQGRELLASGQPALAVGYLLGTLAACLAGVALAVGIRRRGGAAT